MDILQEPIFSKPSIPLRQDWVKVPSLPSPPPLPLSFHSDLLAWFIWWKEFYAGLRLWWYPYTVTFSPRQMFPSHNTLMFIPKSPYKHIKWWLHVYASHRRQKWRGRWHGCRGRRVDEEGEEERRRQTDGDVGHMLRPADDTGMTWRSKGRSGQRGIDHSKCCNEWYSEVNGTWAPQLIKLGIFLPFFVVFSIFSEHDV